MKHKLKNRYVLWTPWNSYINNMLGTFHSERRKFLWQYFFINNGILFLLSSLGKCCIMHVIIKLLVVMEWVVFSAIWMDFLTFFIDVNAIFFYLTFHYKLFTIFYKFCSIHLLTCKQPPSPPLKKKNPTKNIGFISVTKKTFMSIIQKFQKKQNIWAS